MARSFLFAASLMLAAVAASDVLTMTESNFDDIVSGNDFVLVEFYAPWCGHCKSLAPEYEKAATTLKEDGSAVVLGKVDATEEKSLGEKFGVSGFPTLKFFRGGKPTDYDGPRKADGIVNWISKKTGPPCTAVTTEEQLTALKDKSNVVVVGAFNTADADAKAAFEKAALSSDSVTFAVIENNDAVATAAGLKAPGVTMFQSFDEGRVDFDGAMEENAIAEFAAANKLPTVIPFTNEGSSEIFGSDVNVHLLMFGDHDTIAAAAVDTAKANKGKALFVTVSTEHERIMEFFGITEENLPTMRLVTMGEQMRKFEPETDGVDAAGIKSFVDAFFAGDLKPSLKSEDVPETQEGVYVLVGKSFSEVVLESDKDVLVEFYAPWCGHCKSLAPIYDAVAERFAAVDSVVIAKFDATANEHEAVEVSGFPTIKFWKSGAKDAPMEYDGSRDEEGFVEFLKENAGIPFTLPEVADEEEEEEDKEEL